MIAPLFSSRFEADIINGYLKTYHDLEAADQDSFEARSLATDSIDLIDDSVLAETEKELLSRANVKALLEFGIRHRSAGLLDKDNTSRSRFSIQYGTRHGPPSGDERSLAVDLLPHIAKAKGLGRPAAQLTSTHRSLVAAMDRLRIGVCILDGRGGSILYSIDTNVPIGCDVSPMRRAFGLTETEAALAEMLGSGFTNAKIAEQRSKSIETVNVQVKSLLAKTQAANRPSFRG